MDIVLVVQLVVLAVLLGMSGFFSSSETAFFSLNRVQLEQLERDNHPKLGIIKTLLAQPRRLIVTILIGNEFVNVAASNLSATILLAFLASPDDMWWANIMIMLPLLLLLGEITPKTLAVQNNVAFAAALSGPIVLFAKMITPLRWIVRVISDFFTTMIIGKRRGKGSLVTEDMVRTLAEQAASEGSMDATAYQYVENIFNFGNQTVKEIMTPRGSIDFLPLTASLDEVLTQFRKGHHTRMPVFGESHDDIIGILHYRDLIKEDLSQQDNSEKIEKMLRRPMMLPESRLVTDIFTLFYERRLSIALVVDEYGIVTGLVTMENMLKSIFGDIGTMHQSRKAMDAPWVDVVSPNVFRLDAATKLSVLNDYLDTNLKSNGSGAKTLAGLLLHSYGELPMVGDHVIVGNWRFDIEEISRNRVSVVTAQPLESISSEGAKAQSDVTQITSDADVVQGELSEEGSSQKPIVVDGEATNT